MAVFRPRCSLIFMVQLKRLAVVRGRTQGWAVDIFVHHQKVFCSSVSHRCDFELMWFRPWWTLNGASLRFADFRASFVLFGQKLWRRCGGQPSRIQTQAHLLSSRWAAAILSDFSDLFWQAKDLVTSLWVVRTMRLTHLHVRVRVLVWENGCWEERTKV